MNIEQKLKDAKFKIEKITTERRIDGDTTFEALETNSRVMLIIKLSSGDDMDKDKIRELLLHQFEVHLRNNEYVDSIRRKTVKIGDVI